MGTLNTYPVPLRTTSPAYTAAPWKMELYGEYIAVYGADDTRILDIYAAPTVKKDPEACANARLIVAAPALLALVQKLAVVCNERLAALAEEAKHLQSLGCVDVDDQLAEQMEHYRILKCEATQYVGEIVGRQSPLVTVRKLRRAKQQMTMFIVTDDDAQSFAKDNGLDTPLTSDELQMIKRGLDAGLGAARDECLDAAIGCVIDDRATNRSRNS